MPPVALSTIPRWSRMGLLIAGEAPSQARSTTAILARVKEELGHYGVKEFSPCAENASRFNVRWYGWARAWMSRVSSGEVQVTQLADGIRLTVEARFQRLVAAASIFFCVCLIAGVPFVFNLGINLLVILANALMVQIGLRGMVGRVMGPRAA